MHIVAKTFEIYFLAKISSELSMLDVFLRFLHPLRQRIALLRSAKLIFVLIKFIVSEYDSFRFSLSFSASFWTAFVEPGAAPQYTQNLVEQSCCVPHPDFLGGILLFLLYRDICGVRYSFKAGFSMGVEKFNIEKVSAESASPESICLDVKSSVIFSSGCFDVKAFAFD